MCGETAPKVIACLAWVTMSCAKAELPIAWFEEIGPVALFCVPTPMALTLTEKLHEPLTVSVPPVNAMLLPAAVTFPHEPVSPLGVATARPEGSVSVTAMPVRTDERFGLDSEKLKVVVPPNGIELAPKPIARFGGRVPPPPPPPSPPPPPRYC